jgi:SAM-dependent methyltransferase
MHDDANRWNERYIGQATGEPSVPKGLENVSLPEGGRCLDVACGLGEQTLWAASAGYDVVSLDASDVAIEALHARAVELGLDDRIDGRVVDLDQGLPPELDGLCSIVICQRFRDPKLYPQLVAAARHGGLIVITVLSRVGLTVEPGPFHAAPGDLVSAFRDLDVRIVTSVERDGEATLVMIRN